MEVPLESVEDRAGRQIGLPYGLFAGQTMPPTERAARLLVDLLGQVHDALLAAALDDEALVTDVVFVRKLDDLLASITTIRIVGDVEVSREASRRTARRPVRG